MIKRRLTPAIPAHLKLRDICVVSILLPPVDKAGHCLLPSLLALFWLSSCVRRLPWQKPSLPFYFKFLICNSVWVFDVETWQKAVSAAWSPFLTPTLQQGWQEYKIQLLYRNNLSFSAGLDCFCRSNKGCSINSTLRRSKNIIRTLVCFFGIWKSQIPHKVFE